MKYFAIFIFGACTWACSKEPSLKWHVELFDQDCKTFPLIFDDAEELTGLPDGFVQFKLSNGTNVAAHGYRMFAESNPHK